MYASLLKHKSNHCRMLSFSIDGMYRINVCYVENGVDGLKFTRSWLHSSAERVKSRQSTTESEEVSAAASSETSPPAAGSFASATLNVAFLELLQWDDDRVFPEVISTESDVALYCV